MGSFSVWHWAIVLVVVALLFGGRGKLSALLGDAGKGIRAFKKGLTEADEEIAAADPTRPLQKPNDRDREPKA